jgi:hypothetical protein
MIDVYIGIDNITDFSVNFQDRDSFYDILSYINEDVDVVTVFDTKDNKICLFTSSIDETGNKEFYLFVGDSVKDITLYLFDKYNQLFVSNLLNPSENNNKTLNSLVLLNTSLLKLTNTDISVIDSLKDLENENTN